MLARSSRALCALLVAQTLLLPGPAHPRNGEASADLCLQAAEKAAFRTDVPLRALVALTLTETGRSQDGSLQPWPWALNQGGKGYWFATRDAALTHLSDAVDGGVTNIDVGCFQLNYRWHGAAFTSLDAMMEPDANALYAAKLLAKHAGEQGDWIAAAGAYHSATADKAATYLARFRPIYASLGPAGTDQAAEAAAPRPNSFPLLVAGQSATAGSLVPQAGPARPLFEGP